jgi:hypothetical protein
MHAGSRAVGVRQDRGSAVFMVPAQGLSQGSSQRHQQIQAGRGCSLFIVRDVGPFELVRVHGGGSDGQ